MKKKYNEMENISFNCEICKKDFKFFELNTHIDDCLMKFCEKYEKKIEII